jgi:hypothetical protein
MNNCLFIELENLEELKQVCVIRKKKSKNSDSFKIIRENLKDYSKTDKQVKKIFLSPLFYSILSFISLKEKTKSDEISFFENHFFVLMLKKLSLLSPFYVKEEEIDSFVIDSSKFGVKNNSKSLYDSLLRASKKQQHNMNQTVSYIINKLENDIFPGDLLTLFYQVITINGTRSKEIIMLKPKQRKSNEYETIDTLKILFWYLKHPVRKNMWDDWR